MQNDVFLLGAGFSKAISGAMPIVSELSSQIQRFELPPGDSDLSFLLNDNFEKALSFLAERKPWMQEGDQLQQKVMLTKITRNIGYLIGQSQFHVVRDIYAGEIDWILPLVELWHSSRSTVVTLNYDVLVEAMADRKFNGNERTRELNTCKRIYPKVIAPATMRSGLGSWGDYTNSEQTFQLLKLHGSVNWHYSGQNETKGEIIYMTSPSSVPGNPADMGPEEVMDKVPLIVPPVPNKGSLVSHESVSAMWKAAERAFKRCRRLFIIGYSLPANDALMTEFIRRTVAGDCLIEIVDQSESRIISVKAVLPKHTNIIQKFHGNQCVRRWLSEFSQSVPTSIP